MKKKADIVDPLLSVPQVKFRLRDGWGTNAMVLKGPVPTWLKEVPVDSLKIIKFLSKSPAKATLGEIIDYYRDKIPFIPYEGDLTEVSGVLRGVFTRWLRVGDIMIQSKYWDIFQEIWERPTPKQKMILVPEYVRNTKAPDPVVLFYIGGEPVAMFMGVSRAEEFLSLSEFVTTKLEV